MTEEPTVRDLVQDVTCWDFYVPLRHSLAVNCIAEARQQFRFGDPELARQFLVKAHEELRRIYGD